MHPMTKSEAGAIVRAARVKAGLTWAELATELDAPLVWTTAALLGQHPMTAEQAQRTAELLELDEDVQTALRDQPYRAGETSASSDPTIYRFHEAISVYGPALKELIHEEFGDGIMSAINFSIDIKRRPHPDGDRVVVTLDGKFLDYRW